MSQNFLKRHITGFSARKIINISIITAIIILLPVYLLLSSLIWPILDSLNIFFIAFAEENILSLAMFLSAFVLLEILTITVLLFILLIQLINSIDFKEKGLKGKIITPITSVIKRWFSWIKLHASFLYKLLVISATVLLNFLFIASDHGNDYIMVNMLVINTFSILAMLAYTSKGK